MDIIIIWQMLYDLLFGNYQIPQTEMFMTTPGINWAACFGSRTFKGIEKRKGKMQLWTEHHQTTIINSLLGEGWSVLYITGTTNLSWNAELLQLQDIWIFLTFSHWIQSKEYFYIWLMYNLQILRTEIGKILVTSYWL